MKTKYRIIGKRLKGIRTELGYSQQKLSILFKINQSTISHYEVGYILPSLKVARKYIEIAKIAKLKFTLDYIFK